MGARTDGARTATDAPPKATDRAHRATVGARTATDAPRNAADRARRATGGTRTARTASAAPRPARDAARRVSVAVAEPKHACCPRLHEAVELVGKRWTGAILAVLLQAGPMRFSEIAQAIPQLSDRLLSERMKELEARGIVERRVNAGARVEYDLTDMGRELAPALRELKTWARRWLV
jgi:DNA-binding HxlR family transcriptional regulator